MVWLMFVRLEGTRWEDVNEFARDWVWFEVKFS